MGWLNQKSFTINEIVNRLNRIQVFQNTTYVLKNTFRFPREENTRLGTGLGSSRHLNMNYYALTDERIEEIVLSAFNDAGTIMNELGIEFTNNHEVNNIGIKQINGETEEINSEPEISSEIQEYNIYPLAFCLT